ncbi:hypothetical protein FPRO04_13259 [Fusarium proliferatum]|nr:hypothetical protein FPRO04_13259 [Fusarium proliferatum]
MDGYSRQQGEDPDEGGDEHEHEHQEEDEVEAETTGEEGQLGGAWLEQVHRAADRVRGRRAYFQPNATDVSQ